MKNDFKSFLAVEFSNYLQLLLSAGRSTHNHEIMLRSLDSFLLQNHTFEKCLSESIINQWLSTICGTSANKVSYIARYRGLSKYLRSINITAFEPEYPRCSYTYAPYVFSDEEWKRMIASADSLPYSDYNPESAVLFCILLLQHNLQSQEHISPRKRASISSKVFKLSLSISSTPHTSPFSRINGTTISERDNELQAICPGNASTSGTTNVSALAHAAPQTPRPFRIRVQAIGP